MVYEIIHFVISIINIALILIIILVFLRGHFIEIKLKKIIDLRVIAFGFLILKEITHLWMPFEDYYYQSLIEVPETIFLLLFLYGLLKIEKLLSNSKIEDKTKRKA